MTDAAPIYCVQEHCQAPNPDAAQFCQQCGSPLPRRYLWVADTTNSAKLQPNTLLGGRYAVQFGRLVRDTYPGLPPEAPEEEDFSAAILPYLKLFALRPHIPQVYGVVRDRGHSNHDLVLLEQGAFHGDPGVLEPPKLLPKLGDLWPKGTITQQLHWLWQLAHLWPALVRESVAASLLVPSWLRVEGSLLRLLELYPANLRSNPKLSELGRAWQPLSRQAQPELRSFLQALCRALIQEQINQPEQLLAALDLGLNQLNAWQTHYVQIATRTDQGPSRSRNEDACYPPNGEVLSLATDPEGRFHLTDQVSTASYPGSTGLAIVCDGVGGHEGGDIAAKLTIATLQNHLQPEASRDPLGLEDDPSPILSADQPDPSRATANLSAEIERAIYAANEQIQHRNDREQRQERKRMGTTLVMAQIQAHNLYLAHIGDSRAYRITPWGCHQLTLDDDIASREVRLGYALYRQVLAYPSSGTLTQAIGMGSSDLLHPTIQRQILSENCLFLLCTDGLSDHDRVEQNWKAELQPILYGQRRLNEAAQRLIDLANQQNGHDNVTVALIHCQLTPRPDTPPLRELIFPSLPEIQAAYQSARIPSQTAIPATTSPPRSSERIPAFWAGALLLLGLGGALTYGLWPALRQWISAQIGSTDPSANAPLSQPTPSNAPELNLPTSPTPIPPASTAPSALEIGTIVRVTSDPNSQSNSQSTFQLQASPGIAEPAPATTPVKAGTILKVLKRQMDAQQRAWLQLQICNPEPDNSPQTPQPPTSTSGWVQEAKLFPNITLVQNNQVSTSYCP